MRRRIGMLAVALSFASACNAILGNHDDRVIDPGDASRADATVDGAAPDGTGALDASDELPPELDAATDLDAADPCFTSCNSHKCDDAGACHPTVFVTSQTFVGGNLASPAADNACRTAATNASLVHPERFFAWIAYDNPSGGNLYPKDRGLGLSTRPYRLRNGIVVANDYGSLITQNLQHSIDVDENAQPIAQPLVVWSDVFRNGDERTAPKCGDWKLTSQRGGVADPTQRDYRWAAHRTPDGNDIVQSDCTSALRLYCFETVP